MQNSNDEKKVQQTMADTIDVAGFISGNMDPA